LELAKRNESCETKDYDSAKKSEDTESNKETYIPISELSENFVSEDWFL